MIMWSGEPPTTRQRRSPDVPTPHNAALHISPKMLSSTSWDGSGLWVCAKRLERGRFGWPAANGARSVLMRPEELAMLVNGLDLTQARRRKNWMGARRQHSATLESLAHRVPSSTSEQSETFPALRVVGATPANIGENTKKKLES